MDNSKLTSADPPDDTPKADEDSTSKLPAEGPVQKDKNRGKRPRPLIPSVFDAALRQMDEVNALNKAVRQHEKILDGLDMGQQVYTNALKNKVAMDANLDILKQYRSIANYTLPSIFPRNLTVEAAKAGEAASQVFSNSLTDLQQSIVRHQSMIMRSVQNSWMSGLTATLATAMQAAAISGFLAQPVPDPWRGVIRDMQNAMSMAPLADQYEVWRAQYRLATSAEIGMMATSHFVKYATHTSVAGFTLTTEDGYPLTTEVGEALTPESADVITIATLETLAGVPADIRAASGTSEERLFGLSAWVTQNVTSRIGRLLKKQETALLIALLAWLIPNPLSITDESGREQEMIRIQQEKIAIEQDILNTLRIGVAANILYYRVEKDAMLRLGPNKSAQTTGTVVSGEILRQREREGRWIHVETTSEPRRTGWVFDSAVTLIVSNQ